MARRRNSNAQLATPRRRPHPLLNKRREAAMPPRRHRILNPDGSSNVRRLGDTHRGWQGEIGHFLLTVPWPGFIALATSAYAAVNLVFASLYFACGECIENAR